MAVFDATTREYCDVLISRTNTPLQALNLMNDTLYVEASRFFGQRMIREGGDTPEERLAFGFRLATAQEPTPQELDVLTDTLKHFREEFQTSPAAVQKFLEVGEKESPDASPTLAAYTAVASLLFNMDKTLTKD